MQLTGKEIIEKGIITNHCDEGVQQQGVDVRLDRVFAVISGGKVPKEGKTRPAQTVETSPTYGTYCLTPGYYEVTFKEGCNIPNNATLHFKTRSSLVRCGALIHSGQFDAGFHTDKAGAFLQVLMPIEIEPGARVAQALVFTSNEVENLYDGQWQGDKQRTK